jgi:hypothetical protein
VMRWISGFLWAFRRVCRGGDEVDFWVFVGVPAGVPPVVLGGLCTSFIRRAYLHTTSSVLVRRATVGVGNLGLCVCLPCCPSVSVCTLCARCAHAVGTLQCALRSPQGDLFVACVFCVTGVAGVFTLPTRVTQPSFFPDGVARAPSVNSVGNARHLAEQRWERTQKQHRRGRRRHVAESVHNVGTCAVTMGSVSNANSHGERRKRRPQWHEARRYGCEWRADEKTSSYRHDRPSTRNDQKKDHPIDATKRKTTHQERPKERPSNRRHQKKDHPPGTTKRKTKRKTIHQTEQTETPTQPSPRATPRQRRHSRQPRAAHSSSAGTSDKSLQSSTTDVSAGPGECAACETQWSA